MPEIPPRICCYPGCGRLTSSRFCETHQRKYVQERNLRDKQRPNSFQRGYDNRWRRVSEAYRRAHPVCQYRIRCEGAPAEEVDHIIPLDEGGPKYDWSNLRSACKACHRTKTWQDKVRKQTGGKLIKTTRIL